MCWLQQSAQLWYYPTFLLPPLLVLGWIECVLGYRAWRFLVGVNGAVLGFVAGVFMGAWTGASVVMLFAGLAGGVAGAALFAEMRTLGAFVFAAGTGTSLVLAVSPAMGLAPGWRMSAALVVGAASAAGVLAWWRPMMIGLSAVAGAQQMAAAWRAYHYSAEAAPLMNVGDAGEWEMFALLAAVGMMVQVCTTRPRVGKRPELTRPAAPEETANMAKSRLEVSRPVGVQ